MATSNTRTCLTLRDVSALAVASLSTLLICLASPAPSVAVASPAVDITAPTAVTLDAEWAEREGSWWLDSNSVEVELSVAPEHRDRSVWHVTSAGSGVLLDAETGEAIAFEFDNEL